MDESWTLDRLTSIVSKAKLVEELSDDDLTVVIPFLVSAAFGTSHNPILTKKIKRNPQICGVINEVLKYVRFKPKADMLNQIGQMSFEISKLPIDEVIEKLRSDASATSLAVFEQNGQVVEQIVFLVTQLLMLKRLICNERSSLPAGYRFHLFHVESLRELVINCLFVILTKSSLSSFVSIAEFVQIIMITKSPWLFVKTLLLNIPFAYRSCLLAALQVSLPPHIENERNAFILRLSTIEKSSANFLINHLIQYQLNPPLLFDMISHKCEETENSEFLENFLCELLFSDSKNDVKKWLKPFLKQFWRSKLAKGILLISTSLVDVRKHFLRTQNVVPSLVRSTTLIKVFTGLRLLTQWRLENEKPLIDLMTLKFNIEVTKLESFHNYCKVVLASLVLIPQYILDHENEKRFLDWIKWVLHCHSSSEGQEPAPHVETLLNIGVYFLHNKDSELESLVSSVYGIAINLRTENFNRIRIFFAQLVFSEAEMAVICSKMQFTNALSSSNENEISYLPIDCFCNLMSKNTFERSHVSISQWVFSQILNCKFPLHKLMLELTDNFINAIMNPISPDDFREVPFSEKDISKLFVQPFDSLKCDQVFASQTLILYYTLAYKEALLIAAKQNLFNTHTNRFGTFSNNPTSKLRKLTDLQYSERLMELVPIRYIIRRAEKFQTQMSNLYPKLLKLAYNHYPQLFQLNSSVSLKWFFDNSDGSSKLARNASSSMTLYDEENTPLPTAPKLLFLFEDPVKYSQECIRSLLAMIKMTENDSVNMLDAFVSILPGLLKPNIAQRIHNLVFDVWNCINACLPRRLWVKTVNVLISNSNIPAKYTISDLTNDPLIVLKCDERVFRCPTLLTIILRVLSAFLVSSRVYLSHQISFCSGNSNSPSAIKDLEKEDLRAALISTQESTAIQMMLEICLATCEMEEFDNKEASKSSCERLKLREVQGIVCSHVHQMFLEDSNIIKLVHFQGYEHRLLSATTQGIPSMHCCFDFLPELLQQPHRDQQIFAIDLISHLVVLYTIPKAFSVAQLALSVMTTMIELLPKNQMKNYCQYLIPAMGRIAKAFPPLCKDVSSILFRIAEICWSALGAEKSQFSFSIEAISCSGLKGVDSDVNEPLLEILNNCRRVFANIASDCLVYKLH
ncbi:integrator complex subunit 2-like [Convolutriloba macropyga]|uniref:integrator complex subunit 2-like n=1 Tax=Convolutriloba macropyga TaxID=536237 RepID=UPI003F52904F